MPHKLELHPSNQPCSAVFTYAEIALMAQVLRKRYAQSAYEVACRFVKDHEKIEDFSRAQAWELVAKYLHEQKI